MDIKLYEKPVITKFVTVDGVEFELGELLCSLEEIQRTNTNDHFGDYSLRDYELSYPNTMDELVKMGLVKNYTGSRMANLYCIKDKDRIQELIDKLYELDINKNGDDKNG